MKTKTSCRRNSMNCSPLRLGSFLILLALACYALVPQVRAICQEGCSTTEGNTFLGDNALINNTDGFGNTAIGNEALLDNTEGWGNTATGRALVYNTTGFANTANGSGALFSNTTGSYNTATGL